MNARSFLKLVLVAAGIVLLASCSKMRGGADGVGGDGLQAHGLGLSSRLLVNKKGNVHDQSTSQPNLSLCL